MEEKTEHQVTRKRALDTLPPLLLNCFIPKINVKHGADANFDQSSRGKWSHLQSVKETFLIVQNYRSPTCAVFSWSRSSRWWQDLFCCQIQEGGEEKKHHECVSAERERERERGHLVILIVTEPWQWTEELVWAAFYFNRLPLYPTTSHLPPPQYLMKYVEGKQRWGWCADLPPLWLTTTRPVPLLIYKACHVSARVASLASLPRHKGTFKHPVYISGGARGAITKKTISN